MQIIIQKENLVKSLKTVQKAIAVRAISRILSCINIQATNGEIILTTSNSDLEIKSKCIGMILEEGNISLDANLFTNLIMKLPDKDINITSNEENALIQAGDNKKFEIPLCVEDFPFIKTTFDSNHIEISGLKNVINNTSYVINENDNNPIMQAICFETKGKMTGLNSHAVAINEFNGNEDEKLLIPSKNLRVLAGLLEDSDSVNISYIKNFARFETEDFTLTSKLLDGKYFDVDSMLQKNDNNIIVKVNRDELLSSLETLSLFYKESYKPVIFDIKNNICTLSIKSVFGNGNEEIEIEKEGEDLTIAFNPLYMIKSLNAIDDEIITLEFKDSMNPLKIVGDKYLHLLLPVRITEKED